MPRLLSWSVRWWQIDNGISRPFSISSRSSKRYSLLAIFMKGTQSLDTKCEVFDALVLAENTAW